MKETGMLPVYLLDRQSHPCCMLGQPLSLRLSVPPLTAPVAASHDGGQSSTLEQLVALRKDMLRFAQLQLRDAAAAEDVVQDAIEAALRAASSFAGRSSLKTWVFSILRNRIIDHIRRSTRTVAMSSLVEEGDGWEERVEAVFTERGAWTTSARPQAWPNPDESMQDREFWVVFETCLDHLPAKTARVFMMREFLGFEADEICAELGLTTGNCHVILHRARLKLRGCMESGWGRSGGERC